MLSIIHFLTGKEDEPELTDDTEIVDCYDENCIFDFLLPESTSDPNSDGEFKKFKTN